MSDIRLSNKNSLVLTLVSLILLLLSLSSFLFQEMPVVGQSKLEIPMAISSWQGLDIPHTAGELKVLGPVSLIWREYRDHQGHYLWLIAQQTPSVSKLHNVYVSLIASGASPGIAREKIIATRNGPLRVSLLRLQDGQGNFRMGYLWYQWDDRFGKRHNSPNRWAWYSGVLLSRLKHDIPPWRLVEIVTTQDDQPENRLDAFAKMLYELP